MDIYDFNEDGNWYTSYPPLNHWGMDYGHTDYKRDLTDFLATGTPFHLYVHIPFCAKLCYYCICNIVISNDREKIQQFVNHLLTEIWLLKNCGPTNIREIQLGGGTPSHLDRHQFTQLYEALDRIANIRGLDEFAMEIDPRTVTQDDLRFYADFGVTRISFGIQDFDAKVQKAINREQPVEMIEKLLEVRHLFKGVNFDLLYGLPHQTHETIRSTLEHVKRLSPDRVTLLRYAHVPDVRRHMKLINDADLPPKAEMPQMFTDITATLLDSKYEWVGLDHFARRTDSLAAGVAAGTVGRTFNGFTPGRVRDLIGVGPTATGAFGRTYSQSHYDLKDYYAALKKGEFPAFRGYHLTDDDIERRRIIFDLMCNQRSAIDGERFANELGAIPDDLGVYEQGILTLTKRGRVLLRNICSLFDAKKEKKKYRMAQLNMIKRAAA